MSASISSASGSAARVLVNDRGHALQRAVRPAPPPEFRRRRRRWTTGGVPQSPDQCRSPRFASGLGDGTTRRQPRPAVLLHGRSPSPAPAVWASSCGVEAADGLGRVLEGGVVRIHHHLGDHGDHRDSAGSAAAQGVLSGPAGCDSRYSPGSWRRRRQRAWAAPPLLAVSLASRIRPTCGPLPWTMASSYPAQDSWAS